MLASMLRQSGPASPLALEQPDAAISIGMRSQPHPFKRQSGRKDGK
ncbi:hypothetical protein GLE_0460 [Lysobacter enzymogenes]|uniref:Uncharacterized protein n=1 Tax=Lysobacter enzymogenes TaxID=69 RepID=A0A0S2DBD9_LYSEN|nr:hypothetical protein GLE_0460 [Lysobacter enzymogenes]